VQKTDDGLRVVATTPILADLAAQVAGPQVKVKSLIPAGADPHTFEVAPSVARVVAEADLIVANGLGLEGSFLGVIEANKSAQAVLVILGQEVAPGGENVDPHLWLDPRLAAEYVKRIAEAMSLVDPSRADEYRQRAAIYIEELRQLHDRVRQQIAGIPVERRKLVATHRAFSWMAHAYGIEEVGYLVTAPEEEPTPAWLAELRHRILSQKVPAVFIEPYLEAEDQALSQLAEEVGIKVCVLYVDTLDDKVSSYLKLMEYNAQELVGCLGG